MKNLPKHFNVPLMSHTTLTTTGASRDLNKVMDNLVQEVYLGDDNRGYAKARITEKSCNEIWKHYEKLYDAIRAAKYEYIGEVVDLLDIRLARKDKAFQSFMGRIIKE